MTRLEAIEMLREGYEKHSRFDYEQFEIAISALMKCEKPQKRPLHMYLGQDA